jgi:hypothetical protein
MLIPHNNHHNAHYQTRLPTPLMSHERYNPFTTPTKSTSPGMHFKLHNVQILVLINVYKFFFSHLFHPYRKGRRSGKLVRF